MSKKIATREAYGKALAELAKENENVVVLDADYLNLLKQPILKQFALKDSLTWVLLKET